MICIESAICDSCAHIYWCLGCVCGCVPILVSVIVRIRYRCVCVSVCLSVLNCLLNSQSVSDIHLLFILLCVALLRCGAVSIKYRDGAIHKAAAFGHLNVVKYLISEAGVDKNVIGGVS